MAFEVCRRARQFTDIPIIFLSAKDDEADRLVGLHLGADDYVVKPFHVRELIARVKAFSGAAAGSPQPGRFLRDPGPIH